jgi:hypothetical protein
MSEARICLFALPPFGGREVATGEEFKGDLIAAQREHLRTGEPIEVPPNRIDGSPREHCGLWVYKEGQRARYFEYPARVSTFFPDQKIVIL